MATRRQGAPGEEALVGRVLRDFEIRPPRSLAWNQRLADLSRVLRADYEAVVADLAASGRLDLPALEREARRIFPRFNEAPLTFRENVERVRDHQAGLGASVRFAPYGRPGHPLRGFYAGDLERPVIWVNENHTATAMAATLAHEVGHLFYQRIHGADSNNHSGVHLFLQRGLFRPPRG